VCHSLLPESEPVLRVRLLARVLYYWSATEVHCQRVQCWLCGPYCVPRCLHRKWCSLFLSSMCVSIFGCLNPAARMHICTCVFVCIYVYVYLFLKCIYISIDECIYISRRKIFIYIYIQMCIFIHMDIPEHSSDLSLRMRTFIHIYTNIYVCKHMYIYRYIYQYTFTYMHIYTGVYVHTYVCTNI